MSVGNFLSFALVRSFQFAPGQNQDYFFKFWIGQNNNVTPYQRVLRRRDSWLGYDPELAWEQVRLPGSG